MRLEVVVLVALIVAACARSSAEDPRDAQSPIALDLSSTSRPVDAPPQASPSDEVIAAIDGFVASTITVNDPPDPIHPDLARYRTGEVLARAEATVRQNLTLGIAYRLPSASARRNAVTVIAIDGNEATARDCVVDDVQQVAIASGEVLNSATATKLFDVRLTRVDGQWKVAENTLVTRWEGVAGCAVDA
jgi:hypothetical protein